MHNRSGLTYIDSNRGANTWIMRELLLEPLGFLSRLPVDGHFAEIFERKRCAEHPRVELFFNMHRFDEVRKRLCRFVFQREIRKRDVRVRCRLLECFCQCWRKRRRLSVYLL